MMGLWRYKNENSNTSRTGAGEHKMSTLNDAGFIIFTQKNIGRKSERYNWFNYGTQRIVKTSGTGCSLFIGTLFLPKKWVGKTVMVKAELVEVKN